MYWGRIKVIPLGTVTVLEKKPQWYTPRGKWGEWKRTIHLRHCWEFPYLGTLLNASNDIRTEVERRINNANRAYFALLSLLNSHIIPRYVKIKNCKTLIILTILYTAEARILNGETCKSLRVSKRKIVRGSVHLGHWRIRCHHILRLGMKTWTL